jgi:hypothetical protein
MLHRHQRGGSQRAETAGAAENVDAEAGHSEAAAN